MKGPCVIADEALALEMESVQTHLAGDRLRRPIQEMWSC